MARTVPTAASLPIQQAEMQQPAPPVHGWLLLPYGIEGTKGALQLGEHCEVAGGGNSQEEGGGGKRRKGKGEEVGLGRVGGTKLAVRG